ncbi:MAG: HPr-like protein Crh [Firmicutes bacterium ADurb.Bin182]|nr:MAG: HPr-like protein Crh [Firmicutes bacterium ADurb.Bin182]
MLHTELILKSEKGLDAGFAAKLADAMSGFSSRILIEKNNKKVNAKSVMGILSLAVKKDEPVRFIIMGEDEQEALKALSSLAEGGFIS